MPDHKYTHAHTRTHVHKNKQPLQDPEENARSLTTYICSLYLITHCLTHAHAHTPLLFYLYLIFLSSNLISHSSSQSPPSPHHHPLSLSLPCLFATCSLGILIKLGCSLMLSPWQQSPWRGWVCTLKLIQAYTNTHMYFVQMYVHAHTYPYTLNEIIKGSQHMTHDNVYDDSGVYTGHMLIACGHTWYIRKRKTHLLLSYIHITMR